MVVTSLARYSCRRGEFLHHNCQSPRSLQSRAGAGFTGGDATNDDCDDNYDQDTYPRGRACRVLDRSLPERQIRLDTGDIGIIDPRRFT
jgi:hypothetical protein